MLELFLQIPSVVVFHEVVSHWTDELLFLTGMFASSGPVDQWTGGPVAQWTRSVRMYNVVSCFVLPAAAAGGTGGLVDMSPNICLYILLSQ